MSGQGRSTVPPLKVEMLIEHVRDFPEAVHADAAGHEFERGGAADELVTNPCDQAQGAVGGFYVVAAGDDPIQEQFDGGVVEQVVSIGRELIGCRSLQGNSR